MDDKFAAYLNTSHVKVNRLVTMLGEVYQLHLNTSHVKVNRTSRK